MKIEIVGFIFCFLYIWEHTQDLNIQFRALKLFNAYKNRQMLTRNDFYEKAILSDHVTGVYYWYETNGVSNIWYISF